VEAEQILKEAQSRCPVATGRLRDSGRVIVEDNGREIRATIVFGDVDVSYATVVHERVDIHHTHGRSKFLESVLNEARSTLARALAERIKF
jgi:hypothetical protein